MLPRAHTFAVCRSICALACTASDSGNKGSIPSKEMEGRRARNASASLRNAICLGYCDTASALKARPTTSKETGYTRKASTGKTSIIGPACIAYAD